MAIRDIRKESDELLRKTSREVKEIDNRIIVILEDMAETMYDSNGIGLAAVQVGVLKRLVVIDIGDGLIELINPSIVKSVGQQKDVEGCLSVPGKYGELIRPSKVTVEALNRYGEKLSITGDELLARALCHEIDHLDGILFIDKVIKFVDDKDLEGDD